ncbi:anaerobic carbon-monoxide dehydrogenase catalytic subunit [bacterium]|nr:anaerobic carbon-monoxide dehydrogenase catalytic subunit [bacterium]
MKKEVKEALLAISERAKASEDSLSKMKEKAASDGISTCWDRAEAMKICKFGEAGICCRNCSMGPCRITEKNPLGICGATAEVVAARNFCQMIAAGTAAHSDHGRDVAKLMLETARGHAPDYKLTDLVKLKDVARDLSIPTKDREPKDIALDVGKACFVEFGQQEGRLKFIKRAPEKRQEIWEKTDAVPRGVDREVVDIFRRATVGAEETPEELLKSGSRCALADGWGGSMIATELQDILYGTPVPLRAEVNFGVLKEDEVNVIVHGHEPSLSEMIVVASRDQEMIAKAKKAGAKGIIIGGICCTANEVLVRHGIPPVGAFLQQELAIATGVVDAMVVDVQCIMQSLGDTATCYHTKIITTSPKAKMPRAIHMQFKEEEALKVAKEIISVAIENFGHRQKEKIFIPKEKTELVAGFSHETVNYMLGGNFRASYRPLNDNIINGRILGVAGVVGCNNPKVGMDKVHVPLVKELIKNNVLVVQTGCSAIACAKAGLLVPEAAYYAGDSLREVCETVGIPPVLHCGACVDNSRILIACTEMVKEGGLGDDISSLPVAGAAPEWMSEKAIAIGQYFVASGVYVIFGATFAMGSEKFNKLLFEKMEEIYGGMWAYEPDPIKMAHLMINHIKKKRAELGIDKKVERKLFDMADRRALEAE